MDRLYLQVNENQLNKLSECAASLDLTVNIKKTKIANDMSLPYTVT